MRTMSPDDAPRGQALLRVGLGGGIGAGKSSVARGLVSLGARHVDTDAVYHELLDEDPKLRDGIVELFGDVLDDAGRPDRARMRGRLLQEPALFRSLEALSHPLIFDRVDALAAQWAGEGDYLVVEAPLLFESGLDARVAQSIYVTAPLETRWERVRARSGISREQFDAIVARQLDPPEASRRADICLENGGDLAALDREVRRLHALLLVQSPST